MADADKNILITPQIGATADPTIQFKSGATSGDPITLSITDDGTTSTLDFAGSSGQLFSISNDLTGTIFGVADSSGIPIIEADADGTVRLGEFGGNILLGTSTDTTTDKLQTIGNTLFQSAVFNVKSAVGTANVIYAAEGTTGVTLYNNGTGRLATTTTGVAVTGEITATGDITAYFSSDSRLKENVRNIENPIDKVKMLNGYNFDWTDEYLQNSSTTRKDDVGVIAQELQSVLPEVVIERDNGYLAVNYPKIVALLIEAIKQQQTEIDELKTINT